MAKNKPATVPQAPQPPKLARLPDSQKICKRPLLHAPIASPYTTSSISPKTLYISPSTPFASTIKRVRTLLSHIESRASGPISFSSKLGPQITAGIKARRDGSKEEVILKGTGRAIEKVLGIAVYWQGQADVVVRVRTGSVGAVDDVVENGNDEVETGESRVRRTSCLEVGISLR